MRPVVKSCSGLFLCLVLSIQLWAQHTRIVVSQDGEGDYRTVGEAFNALPTNSSTKTTIFVRNGVYREKLRLPRGKSLVCLVGEDKFKSILTYDDHTGKVSPKGDTINTRTSASFLMLADN